MFNYYLALALRSLKRNVVLTLLMIAAIGVGIGASMTTLTLFRAMDADPIPQKSRQLFAVQIDNWGPSKSIPGLGDEENLQPQISYIDAMGLMNAHAALAAIGNVRDRRGADARQCRSATLPGARSRNLYGFLPDVRGAFSFWTTLERRGRRGPCRRRGDFEGTQRQGHSAARNSVGKTLNLDDHDYRVVGVLSRWQPMPKFYDLNNNQFGTRRRGLSAFYARHRRPNGQLGQLQLFRRCPAIRVGRVCCIPNASGCSSGRNYRLPRMRRIIALF